MIVRQNGKILSQQTPEFGYWTGESMSDFGIMVRVGNIDIEFEANEYRKFEAWNISEMPAVESYSRLRISAHQPS